MFAEGEAGGCLWWFFSACLHHPPPDSRPRQLVIEGLHSFSFLPEQIGNQGLLAVFDSLQVRKDFSTSSLGLFSGIALLNFTPSSGEPLLASATFSSVRAHH